MAQYIDKSALVAEIERKIKASSFLRATEDIRNARQYAYKDILSFIDTLEVKEVDFENELDRIWFSNGFGEYFNNDAVAFAHIRTICKHFFELGLKAQKGE